MSQSISTPRRVVLLLSGKKCVGKDTFSNIICRTSKRSNIPFYRLALADELKEQLIEITAGLVRRLPNVGGIPDYFLKPELKEVPICDLTFRDSGKAFTARNLMQWYGQVIKATFDELIWVNLLLQHWVFQDINKCNIVITDCRFKYELEELKNNLQDKFDVITVRIKRTTGLIDSDISETDLDSLEDSYFDYILENNTTKEDFRKKVKDLKSIIFKRK